MKKGLTITVDGPSGAGKSTVAKMLARSLGYTYIDTGAMYRGIAYAYQAESVSPLNDMETFLKNLSVRFEFGETARVFLDDKDISEDIRAPEISLLASNLSQKKEVRGYLTKKQRETGGKGGIVMEGRDTGSVVFPDADIKFYLDANPDERAKRRHIELSAKGIDAEISRVKEEMLKRDRDDSEREIAPLTIPQGAVVIDTTGIDAKGVVDALLKHINGLGQ
ncbi:MAG: (d)CMP kinase [Proteobacteria bacterium]|nr:(d)CMP kinase [Pseudomonadota bacterium]